jgi:pantothenate kinase type III
MIDEMGTEPHEPASPKIIATGGLARLIAEDSRFIETIDDMLTLDGLRLVFEKNHPAPDAPSKPARPRKHSQSHAN